MLFAVCLIFRPYRSIHFFFQSTRWPMINISFPFFFNISTCLFFFLKKKRDLLNVTLHFQFYDHLTSLTSNERPGSMFPSFIPYIYFLVGPENLAITVTMVHNRSSLLLYSSLARHSVVRSGLVLRGFILAKQFAIVGKITRNKRTWVPNFGHQLKLSFHIPAF